MSGHKPWREVRRGNPNSPESVALRDAVGDALALAEIRERRSLTQVDVARVMQTSQASVSKLERREDLYLSTLRGFVEALGGRLELSAVFPDGRIEIARPGGEPAARTGAEAPTPAHTPSPAFWRPSRWRFLRTRRSCAASLTSDTSGPDKPQVRRGC